MDNQEEWRSVHGYEGLYEVSSLGRIRGVDRVIDTKQGKRNIKGRIITGNPSWGYPSVTVCKDGLHRRKTIHRMVASAFLGPSDLFVDHIDRNRTNNKVSNLRYCTQRENVVFFMQERPKTSNFVGVLFIKSTGMWKCGIRNNGSYTFLGNFFNEKDASEAYKLALECIENNSPIKLSEKRSSRARKRGKYKTSKEAIGVYFNKRDKKWISYATVNSKMVVFGRYKTQEEAKIARVQSLVSVNSGSNAAR